jgi:hypothetical protein
MAAAMVRFDPRLPWALTSFNVALLVAFVALLLRLAFTNHVTVR